MIEVEIFTGPSFLASALVNGDASGLETDRDFLMLDSFTEMLADDGWSVVSVDQDTERFTWCYRLYGGNADGGSVVDYIAHRITKGDTP